MQNTTKGKDRLRVLLVDNNIEFLELAAQHLAADPTIEVVGSAMSGREALEQVSNLSPDVVLVDLAMPGMNGLELTRRLKALPHPPCVIIVTLYDEPEYRAAALAAQADAFVAKADFYEQVGNLLRMTCDGEASLSVGARSGRA